jgi:cobyrinic acid a,c-diamide synthase
LPRVIIADESTQGTVPAGVLLLYALQRVGVDVKIFTCARDEAEMRLLRLLFSQDIVSLDAYTCGGTDGIRALFQEAASPSALNVILTPLCKQSDGNEYTEVRPEPLDMSRALSCGIVAVFSAMASSILSSRAVMETLSAFSGTMQNNVLGIIFSSVRNIKEYQLLEQHIGRNTSLINLGHMSAELNRPMPFLPDLFNASAGARLTQVKSAALQLASRRQIEWHAFQAFGRLYESWTGISAPDSRPKGSFDPKDIRVAIVGDSLFSLEGANAAKMFGAIGCSSVEDYNPLTQMFPGSADLIYFPNSVVGLYADKLMNCAPFVNGVKNAMASRKLMFINGAFAPLFCKCFVGIDRKQYDGIGIFSCRGSYSAPVPDDGSKEGNVEVRGTDNSILTRRDEKLRGRYLSYVQVSNPGNAETPLWAYRDARKDMERGYSGWQKANCCLMTELNIETWSNVGVFNRLLTAYDQIKKRHHI